VRVRHIHHYEIEGKTEERYVDIIASPVKDSEGNILEVVEVMRDVTEARRLEEQIEEASKNLLALNVIASTVSQSMDLDTVLNAAFDKVLELMEGTTGGILLLDEESQTLSYRVYRGLSEEFVKTVAGLKLGEGITGRVAKQEKPIYVDDLSKDPRITCSAVIKEGLRAFASLPLRSKNKLLGVMNVASHTERPFSRQDIELLTSIANQIAVVIENAALYNEVQLKEEMRGELLRQIISTQEEERKRIARELHDETSQALSGVAVNIQAIIEALPLDTKQVKAKLQKIQSLTINTLNEIHRVIYELRPSLLDDLGLAAAVEWHAESYLRAAGIKVHLETDGVERRLPAEVETALFRIIQEATANIVRHAGAENTSIALEFKESSIAIRIEDNGRGFDLDKVIKSKDRWRGLGLLSMKERAEFLGGMLKIQSRPGIGTQIVAEIPVNGEVSK
jgi:signal transduction histidine kinase